MIRDRGEVTRDHNEVVRDRDPVITDRGAIIRGNVDSKEMAIVFTGDEFADGGKTILQVLATNKIKASFFFTGNFYANKQFMDLIRNLKRAGHYLGAHSDKHLLYCDWIKRDSLLVTKQQFVNDLSDNYRKMKRFGIRREAAKFFLPPFEWFNDTIAGWTRERGLQLINFTPGTRTNVDYTTPGMKGYRSSEEIFQSVVDYEKNAVNGLNGYIMLVHIGTDAKRTDKFYNRLGALIQFIKDKGYNPVTVDELLGR